MYVSTVEKQVTQHKRTIKLNVALTALCNKQNKNLKVMCFRLDYEQRLII